MKDVIDSFLEIINNITFFFAVVLKSRFYLLQELIQLIILDVLKFVVGTWGWVQKPDFIFQVVLENKKKHISNWVQYFVWNVLSRLLCSFCKIFAVNSGSNDIANN